MDAEPVFIFPSLKFSFNVSGNLEAGIREIPGFEIVRTGSFSQVRRTSCSSSQCTASLFDAAPVFFGSVSSSTPSLYLAWAVAWSTSCPSVNARWSLP
jgi:hypothetical protein